MEIVNCPCGRIKLYNNCCGLIHENITHAKTAEDLMRSRYSAFVLADGDYLMLSQHSSTRNINDKDALMQWARSVKWQKLEVLNSTFGSAQDQEGTVEFKAYYKEGLFNECIHEHSKFVKENGYWVYLGIV